MKLDTKIRRTLTTAIRRSKTYSRELLAEELEKRLSVRVTRAMLDSYTAASKREWRLPLLFAPTICEVLNDFELLAVAIGPHLEKVLELERKRKLKHDRKRAGLHIASTGKTR